MKTSKLGTVKVPEYTPQTASILYLMANQIMCVYGPNTAHS